MVTFKDSNIGSFIISKLINKKKDLLKKYQNLLLTQSLQNKNFLDMLFLK